MGQHPGAQVVAGGEQRAALAGRDPVEAAAQPGMERHVPAGLEQERVEVRLAELPIAGPRGAGLVGGERSDVDEGRARPDPLNVERGRVLEGYPLVERGQGEVELQQGGIPGACRTTIRRGTTRPGRAHARARRPTAAPAPGGRPVPPPPACRPVGPAR